MKASDPCDCCDLPRYSFIGPEKNPIAKLCFDHDRRFVKSNMVTRGKMLAQIKANRKTQ